MKTSGGLEAGLEPTNGSVRLWSGNSRGLMPCPPPLSDPIDTGIVAAAGVVQTLARGTNSDEPTVAGVKASKENGVSGNKGGITDDEIVRFMAQVVPWPEKSNAPGFVNLHWTFWDGDEVPANPHWSGIPTRGVAEFMAALQWVRAQRNTRDIYFCLSLQSQTRQNKRGKTVAFRRKENALALKAIWLDIDIKAAPNGYECLADATAALSAFCETIAMPSPDAVVRSGGGLHVYWISDQPLTLGEWRPYAEGLKAAALNCGLKCDGGCTTNAAQVLRVPGTFNCKQHARRPVLLERSL